MYSILVTSRADVLLSDGIPQVSPSSCTLTVPFISHPHVPCRRASFDVAQVAAVSMQEYKYFSFDMPSSSEVSCGMLAKIAVFVGVSNRDASLQDIVFIVTPISGDP